MDGIGYNLNDAIENLYKRSKEDDHTPFYKKKWFIISMIGISALIVVMIILLCVFLTKKNKKVLGEINCVYDINDVSQKVYILSPDFNKGQNDFDIVIDDKKIEFTKDYQFSSLGNNKINFKINFQV